MVGWHKKGWHKVLKKWGGIKEGGIRFLGGGIKRGWHKILKKNGGWHKKGGVKKKPMMTTRRSSPLVRTVFLIYTAEYQVNRYC